MRRRVAISVDLRQMRSPRCPKKMPPMGRAMKPTRKVVRDRSVATKGLNVGKKSLGKTSEAIVPYRKKSYHSMVVPSVLARMTGNIFRRENCSPMVDMMSSNTDELTIHRITDE